MRGLSLAFGADRFGLVRAASPRCRRSRSSSWSRRLAALALCYWLIAAVLKLVGVTETDLTRHLLATIVVACGLLIVAIVVLALLRAIVYFRDVYRATNYGVPDLVEVIRQIDREAVSRLERLGETKPRPIAGASRSRSSVTAWAG